MAANMQVSTNVRFHRALTLPLYQRCYELNHLIEECSIASFKEIHVLFPYLLDNIFSSGSQPGWDLKNLRRHIQQREFDIIRSFLAPEGTVMRLVYRLMNDVYLKYEFPVGCLPAPARRCLEDGIVPPFYANKIQSHSPGKLPSHLSLNPFELYMFHFAQLLTINPSSQRLMVDWSQADSLYAHLSDDYLHYFLPNDGRYPPTAPFVASPGRPMSPNLVSNRNSQGSRLGLFGSTSLMSLLKQPVFTRQISASGSPQLDVSHVEIWRTEVFVQILTELWLNHYNVDTYRNVFFSPDKSHQTPRSPNWSLDSSSYNVSAGFSFSESFFPTTDHMLLLRMLIKHLHYFSNSARENSSDHFNEFKKNVVHQVLQKKLYGFLNHTFDHWPLDASFKVVLELWLCYIQPWRYLDTEEKERVQMTRWQLFVEENVVFYSQFFRKMIPRLQRVELSSMKHASMFYRLSKVFGQGNFAELIKNAENLLHEPAIRLSTGGRNTSNTSHSSPSRHSGMFSRSATEISQVSVVRQHVGELLGTNTAYVPMFGQETQKQMLQLLLATRTTKEIVLKLMSPVSEPASVPPSHAWSLWTAMGFGGKGESHDSDANFIELQRVQQHLEYSLIQQMRLFQISEEEIDIVKTQSIPRLAPTFCTKFQDDSGPSDESSFLGPTSPINKSFQMLNKQRRPDVTFRGNPDLEPIVSYEIAFLVRMFHRLSTQINKRYGPEIEHLYERDDFIGRIGRQFIQPPRVASSFAHYGTPSPRCDTYLPPRTSLRGLATQQSLGTFLCYFGVAYIFNIGTLRAVIIGIFFFALWTCGVALFQTYLNKIKSPSKRQQHESGTDGQIDFMPVTPTL